MKEKRNEHKRPRPDRRRLLRLILRTGVRLLVYPLAALVALVLIAVIVLQTETARHEIKSLVEKTAESRFQGRLQVGKISGSLLFDFSLEQVRFSHREEPLLTVRRISANYFLPLLLARVFYIHEFEVEGLSLNLVQAADGHWNIEALLPSAKKQLTRRKEADPFSLFVGRMALRETAVSITEKLNHQSRTRRVNDLRLTAGFTLGAGYRVNARIMEMAFKADPGGIALDSLRGKIAYHPGKNQFEAENLRIRSNGGDLTLSGMLGWDSGMPSVDLKAEVNALSVTKTAAALNLPAPVEGTIHGLFLVRGTPKRIYHELALYSGRASLRTRGHIDELTTERLRVDISGAVRQVDPQKLLLPAFEKITGELNCDFKIKAANFSRTDQAGEVRLLLRPSTVQGVQISQGSVHAAFDRYRIVLKESRLIGPQGSLRIHNGLAEIFDPDRKRTVTLNASLENADLKEIFRRPEYNGKINFDVSVFAELAAPGQELHAPGGMSARVDMTLNPSVIMGIGISRGRAVSTWDGKHLGFEELDLSSDVGRLTMTGSAVPAESSGRIKYSLAVPRLERALPLVARLIPEANRPPFEKMRLSGGLYISGESSGRWDQPALSARITVKDLNYNDYSAGVVQVTADWRGGAKHFQCTAATEIKNLKADRIRLSDVNFTLNLLPETARVDIRLARDRDATARIAAEVKGWAGPVKTINVDKFQLSLDNGGGFGREFELITNRQPLRMTFSKNALKISAFELVSGRAIFSMKGDLLPDGKLKTKMSLRTVDLRPISRLWQHKESIDGMLSASAEISGSLDRPVIQTDLEIENSTGYDFSFARITGNLIYRQERLFFRVNGQSKERQSLDINGNVGISLSLVPFHIDLHPNGFEVTAQAGEVKLSSLPIPSPEGVRFDGVLNLTGSVAGSLDAPEIKTRLSVKDGWISYAGAPVEKVTFQNFETDVDYRNSRVVVDAALFRQNRKALELKGQAGFQIALLPFRLIPLDKDLNLHLTARDLALSQLPLPKPADLKLDGILNLDVSASGSIARPVIAGNLKIREGYLSYPRRALSYETVTADIGFSERKIAISEIYLKGGEKGQLWLKGEIETKGLKPTAFNLRLNGENVYIPYKPSGYARVRPELFFSGTPEKPELTGTLTVTESRIYVDQLTQKGPVEIQIDTGRADDSKLILLDQQKAPMFEFLEHIAADVIVDVPKNAWLKRQDLNVEILGKVNLKKARLKPFTLLGTLNTVRGTYDFQGKLFKITRGSVDFVGLEEPDPNLDIVAETRIKAVNIRLKISGTARDLRLSLESDPPLEQSDIIAYLVFGRSINDLDNQQGFNAQQAALNITGRMAVNELKNILGDAFFLDTLTLESGGEDIRQGGISTGKYVSQDVFVLYRHRFKADEPDQVEVTYEFNRNFSVETQLGNEKSSGIDLIWEFDF